MSGDVLKLVWLYIIIWFVCMSVVCIVEMFVFGMISFYEFCVIIDCFVKMVRKLLLDIDMMIFDF